MRSTPRRSGMYDVSGLAHSLWDVVLLKSVVVVHATSRQIRIARLDHIIGPIDSYLSVLLIETTSSVSNNSSSSSSSSN